MIDHLMTFASEAAAKSDQIIGQYFISDGNGGGSWRGDCCVPSVSVIVVATGLSYDSNWRIMIGKPTTDPTLMALSSCHLVADRDAAANGRPFVLQSVLTTVQLSRLAFSPVFAGSKYTFVSP